MTITDWTEKVVAALQRVDRYNPSLDLQIYSLASALRSLEIINKDIDELETSFVDSPQGIKAHPAFSLLERREASVTKQMKALGLTSEDMPTGEVGPLAELTESLINLGAAKRHTVNAGPRKATTTRGKGRSKRETEGD